MSFQIALSNVILTLLYIIPGYAFCKWKKVAADHLSTLSAILVYLCSPCMVVASFLSLDFSLTELANMGLFFVVTLVVQGAFMAILYAILSKKYEDSKYRIFTIGSVLGNVGFFGQPLVRALLPNKPEALCYSSVYCITMNLLVFSMGVYCLTKDKKYMTLKAAILTPNSVGLCIGLPIYIFGLGRFIPDMLVTSVDLLGRMTTPLCMLILGIRLATVPLKRLFTRPIIYLLCVSKMILFPLFAFLLVYFLPVADSFKASLLILSSVPCASIILNMAELHHSETELAANCVLVTTLLCFITIPIMTLLL